jgi:hypothetical protein
MLQLFLWLIALLVLAIAFIVVGGRSTKDSIYSNMMFALTHVGAAAWIISIALFLNASAVDSAGVFLKSAFISALVMPLGFWAYAFSLIDGKHKAAVRSIFSLIGVITVASLVAMIATDGSLVYGDIMISGQGNTFEASTGPFIWSYLGAFFVMFSTYCSIIIRRSKQAFKAGDSEQSKGYRNICFGMLIGSLPTVLFNSILPIMGNTELVWLGPTSVALSMIVVYFTTLRYKIFVTTNQTLQYVARLVLVLLLALVYSGLFYVLFLVIFRGAEPALPVIALNFLMFVALILLFPVINLIRSYVAKQVDQEKK